MSESDFPYGALVVIPWARGVEVIGKVHEVYGPPERRHVVVMLTPELSDLIVDEPTTVSLPLSSVRPLTAA